MSNEKNYTLIFRSKELKEEMMKESKEFGFNSLSAYLRFVCTNREPIVKRLKKM